MNNPIFDTIAKIGIVPVIAIYDVEKAVPLTKALQRGGISCAEVTFRTAEGEESIRRIVAEVPEILVGAGTVLTVEQVEIAIDAGAKFLVTPGFNPKVVDYCINKGLTIIPGCSTPTDMEQAIERGLQVVKFFPAEANGGLDYIKAVAGPYPMLRFIPTGSIGPGNLAEYLSFGKVLACGGSWMVKAELVDGCDFDAIARLSREAAEIAKREGV